MALGDCKIKTTAWPLAVTKSKLEDGPGRPQVQGKSMAFGNHNFKVEVWPLAIQTFLCSTRQMELAFSCLQGLVMSECNA